MTKPIDNLKTSKFSDYAAFLLKSRDELENTFRGQHALQHYIPHYQIEMQVSFCEIKDRNFQLKRQELTSEGLQGRRFRCTDDRVSIEMGFGFFDYNPKEKQVEDNLFRMVDHYARYGADYISLKVWQPNLEKIMQEKIVLDPREDNLNSNDLGPHQTHISLENRSLYMQNIWGSFADISLEKGLKAINKGKQEITEKIVPVHTEAKEYAEEVLRVCNQAQGFYRSMREQNLQAT